MSAETTRTAQADLLYWAVLDAPHLHAHSVIRRAKRQDQLGFLFESMLPVHLEDVHSVYTQLDGGRWLACGMRQDRLSALATPSVRVLRPDRIPEWLDADAEPDRLNLLTGTFTPHAVRRESERRLRHTSAVVFVIAAMLAIGFWRRADTLHTALANAEHVEAEIYRTLYPSGNGQPPSVRFIAEQRRLQQSTATPDDRPLNAVPGFVELLAAWPRDVHASAESVQIDGEHATLICVLDNTTDTERFGRGLGRAKSWSMSQPQLSAQRDTVRGTFRLTREDRP